MADERLKRGGSILSDRYFEEQLQRVREIPISERKFYQRIADIYVARVAVQRGGNRSGISFDIPVDKGPIRHTNVRYLIYRSRARCRRLHEPVPAARTSAARRAPLPGLRDEASRQIGGCAEG